MFLDMCIALGGLWHNEVTKYCRLVLSNFLSVSIYFLLKIKEQCTVIRTYNFHYPPHHHHDLHHYNYWLEDIWRKNWESKNM